VGIYGDIDDSPTKRYMLENRDDPAVAPLFELAFGKRPAEELYRVTDDPGQMHNLADDPNYASIKEELRARLEETQRHTEDPRIRGLSPWENYPFWFGPHAENAKK
jgi:uncharacterized sulfatase